MRTSLTNLIKPLFKLTHYPHADPTAAPDIRACPQIMSLKKDARVREAKARYEGNEDS